jgi:putative ABC transport system permease protein
MQGLSGIRRHRLQTAVVFVIAGLAITVGAMGGTLLVQTSSPYDHAFDVLAGPHLVVTFDASKTTSSVVAATATLPGVTAAGGPWAVADVPMEIGDTKFEAGVVGRDDPGGKLDRVQLVQGRWVRGPGEIVLTRALALGYRISVGDRVKSLGIPDRPVLTVVGEAVDVIPYANRGWVSSGQVGALVAGDAFNGYRMVYRFRSAATRADLRADVKEIEENVPVGAVLGYSSYLDFRDSYNFTNSLILTFLFAFAALALGAVAVIVANVVTGAVLASYRDIGILKAIGFVPRQVVLVFVVQMLIPGLVAAVIGVPLGALAAKPLLNMAADAMGLPAPSALAYGVDALVLFAGLGIVVAAAALPAWRASRLNAVTAITTGTAPSGRWSTSLHGRLGWWTLPRPVAVGAGDAFARPLRGALTVVAILVGVATLVFASGLYTAILRFNDLFTSPDYQVTVSRFGGFSDAATMDLLQRQSGTSIVVGERQLELALPGQVDPVPAQILRGSSERLGYKVAEGRWFTGPGEAVVGVVFNPYHWRVGQTVDVVLEGKPLQVHVTGACYCFFSLSMDWSTLAAIAPTAQPSNYLVQLRAGTNVDAYIKAVSLAEPDFLAPSAAGGGGGPGVNIEGILDTLVAALAVVLGLIAGLGVFNTLLLTTRERVRDIAILKAIGMTPGQVSAMVMTSAFVLGSMGAILGIPAGIVLYDYLVDAMARVANFTISSSSFQLVIHPLQLGGVALAGVLVAMLGAILPARWAARAPAANVLNIE